MTKYIFDTDAWIDANYRASVKMFPTTLWAKYEEEIKTERIVLLKAVYDEITKSSDNLSGWFRNHSESIYNHLNDNHLLQEAKVIVNKYPSIVNPRNTNDQADPYLIAYAVTKKVIVVTNERMKNSKINIPYICHDYNIKTVTLQEFYNKVSWTF